MNALVLANELAGLLQEAETKEAPPPPSKKDIRSTLDRMSSLAHQQTKHAKRINSPAAHALAAKTHSRVALAAKRHGHDDLHKQHSAIAKAFRKAAKADAEPSGPKAPRTDPVRTPKHAPTRAHVPHAIPGSGPPGGPPPKVKPHVPHAIPGSGPPGGPPPNVKPVKPKSGGNIKRQGPRFLSKVIRRVFGSKQNGPRPR